MDKLLDIDGRDRRRTTLCVIGLRGIPGVMGGVETHCEYLYTRMAAQEEDTRIVVFGRRPYMKERRTFEFRGTTVVPAWAIRDKYLEAILHTGWTLLLSRLRQGADLLHIHSIGPGLWSPLARLLGMTTVVTIHGQDHKQSKWNAFARFVLRTGERVSLRFADAVIVVSGTLYEDLRKRYPRDAAKLFHIPNGADHLSSEHNPRDLTALTELGLSPQGYLLSVGRLIPGKGFEELIEAHQASGSALPLVIAGSADHPNAFTEALLKRAAKNVIFAGFQSRERLAALYANARLCISASHHEGNPIVALEAISMDTPLLLSDIKPHLALGLSPDHYFPVRDTKALRARLSAPAETYQHPGKALLRAHSWDIAAASTISIYRSLRRGYQRLAPGPATDEI